MGALRLLSGGAAQGLVAAIAARFAASTGCEIDGTFSAVGAMRDKLLAGAPADALILTEPLIAELARAGHGVPGSARKLGAVPTCIAVRAGDPVRLVSDAGALRYALLAADAVYYPDPELATAGIHFAKVVDALGIASEIAPRLRPFPNGAAAMRAMANAPESHPIGCTQATEILNTPGVTLVAQLPPEFALAMVYTAAVCTRSTLPGAAHEFVAMLSNGETRGLRQQLGFALAPFQEAIVQARR